MNYIVAYTLKHKEKPDTFVDRWQPFLEEEGMSLFDAKTFYNQLIETDGGEEEWWLFTVSIATILESTDY